MAADFDVALSAFDLMTRGEKIAVLKTFATLRYPSIADRFFEAVYRNLPCHRVRISLGETERPDHE